MALVAIILIMIGTFSVFVDKFADGAAEDYSFLEDTATLKSALCRWVAERDTADSVFVVNEASSEKPLQIDGSAVKLSGGVLYYRDQVIASGLDSIGRISFECERDLIKCTVLGFGEDSEISFAFAVRAGSVQEVS